MPTPSVTDGLTRVLISHTSLTGQVIIGMTHPVLGSAALKNIGDFLQRSLNLSDLTDVVAARNNLGLGTAATHNVGPHLTRGPGLPNEVVLFRHLGDAAYKDVSEITALFPEVPETFLDLTDTPDVYSGTGTGGNLLFSTNAGIAYTQGATNASWDATRGVGVANGRVGASGGDGVRCLEGGTLPDGSQAINFTSCTELSVAQAPDPSRNWFAAFSNVGTLQSKITMDGVIFARNTTVQAADYAEWFEGENDIPAGVTVVMENGKVRAAVAGDDPTSIYGVVRPRDTRAALIGNAAETHWAKMYVVDDFDAPVWVDFRDVDGTVYKTQAVNPDYDPSLPYVPRSQRPEWNLIGMLGQIPVRVGQPVHPAWIKMRSISARADLYLVIR